ncbi:MAG: hypothetical protein FWC40_08480, partial [Proteobacteria bacterium]|nr:hypothetical protein [Pseudomonadota bacterium]
MLKRNLFIILSGVIAATAVLGWMPSLQCEWFPDSLVSSQGDTVETAVPSSDVSSHVRDELVQVLTSSIERLQGVVDEAQLPERLGGTLSVPHVRLMDPEVPPLIEPLPIVVSAESKANSALMSLSQAPGLSSAGLVAIADLAEGRILASAPSEGVQEILLEIRADEQFHRGARFRVSEFFLEALVWACVDDTRRICVISTFPVSLAAQGAEGCQMASESVRIQCDGKSLEGGKVFDAQGCSGAPPSEVVSIWRSIQSQTEASGRVSVKGQSYGYDKQAFGSDCHVTAFFPISAGTDSSGGPVVEKGLFTPFQMLIALVAGILVFCLGLVCTRRRREESQDGDAAQEDVSSSLKDKDEEAACLRASLSSSREEGLRLEKEVRRLETEKGNLDSKVTQLEEQLQFARQSYQKAQEASERPRAASTPVTPPSAIEHDRGQKQTESVASSGKGDSRDRLTEEVPEVTMASILTHDAPVAELTDVGVVPMPDELFPDDGWDEIAAGFDAILVDKRAETVSAKTDVGLSSLGMLEGASPEESSFG